MNPRMLIHRVLVALTALVLLSSIYLQYAKGLEPCPLCYMQRACVLILLVCGVLISSFAAKTAPARILLIVQGVIALAGVYFAARQLWLQTLPSPDIVVCLPGIELLLHYFPWQDLFALFFWGSAACNEVLWTAFGFSMAAWSLWYFVLMGCGLLWLLIHSE